MESDKIVYKEEIEYFQNKLTVSRRISSIFKNYFSGKTAVVQVIAGVAAFAGRSLASYFSTDLPNWENVLFSHIGSYLGYVGTYIPNYWCAFRKEYRGSDKSMLSNIVKLQGIEQTPNIINVISSASSQAGLMATGLNPVVAANLASWFGPHKILNLLAMAGANSVNKAMVYRTWDPKSVFYTYPKRAILQLGKMVHHLYSE